MGGAQLYEDAAESQAERVCWGPYVGGVETSARSVERLRLLGRGEVSDCSGSGKGLLSF